MTDAWSLACPDWRERLIEGRSLLPDLPLNRRAADVAVTAFDYMRLADVPGTPTMAEAGSDYLRDVVRAVFGSLDPASGSRRVQDVFVLVPKKNNKTTGGGLIMLTALMLNRRPNAQFAFFGPVQRTAQDAYDAAAGAIELDEDLKRVLYPRDHLKLIQHRKSGATLSIASFDPALVTGKKYAGWLFDEIHVLGRDPKAVRVLAQMRGGRAAIAEQFGVIITTQSDEPPAGVFKAELDRARGVRDGRIADGTLLPLLYEFPEEVQKDRAAPWRNPALWARVNPNMGHSVSLQALEGLHREARDKGEDAEALWASQHLNIQLGQGAFDGAWPGARHWPQASLPGLTLEGLIAQCEVCTVGIDGGGLDDLLGLYVLGRTADGVWLGWGHAWADRGVLKLRKDIAPKLQDLASDGDLSLVDIAGDDPAGDDPADDDPAGDAEPANAAESETETTASSPLPPPPEMLADAPPDVAGVAAVVWRLWQAGLLPEKAAIGVDAVGIAAIGQAIESMGVPVEMIAAVPQGYRLSGVIKGAARKLKDGTLKPADQALMRWVVGNARQEARGNAVLVTKQISGSAKIDPLIALFNAFDLMSRNPEAPGLLTGADILEVI